MLSRLIDRLEEVAIAGLLLVMTVVTFTQVVLRYAFNSGFVWALEATTYAFLWMVLLGLSYGIRTNAHIGVDLVVNHLPAAARRALGLVGVALCLAYAGMMFWGSVVFVERMLQLGSFARDLPLPRWALSLALPLGFGLLCFRLLQVALAILQGRRDRIGLGHEDDAEAHRGLAAHPGPAPAGTPTSARPAA